jgi:hypothetical protein
MHHSTPIAQRPSLRNVDDSEVGERGDDAPERMSFAGVRPCHLTFMSERLLSGECRC